MSAAAPLRSSAPLASTPAQSVVGLSSSAVVLGSPNPAISAPSTIQSVTVQPADPTQPKVDIPIPGKPVVPTTPVVPMGPGPAQPPTQPAGPGPSVPTQPIQPSGPSQPSGPGQPSGPSQPSEPSQPTIPDQPIDQGSPSWYQRFCADVALNREMVQSLKNGFSNPGIGIAAAVLSKSSILWPNQTVRLLLRSIFS